MSYVNIRIHAVWGTKNRAPLLSKELRTVLFEHIHENAKQKQIYIDTINGYDDHVHCLFNLNADMSVARVLQLIKGEAAFWANKQGLVKPKLEWADEYFAASISESVLDKVRSYIRNQEDHHRVKTFAEEYDEFISRYRSHHQG